MTSMSENNFDIIKKFTNGSNYPRLSEGGEAFYNAYMNLSQNEGAKLVTHALETDNKRTQWAILKNLAVYYPSFLSQHLDTILDKEIKNAAIVFKGGDDNICQEIIKRLETSSNEKLKLELLIILAWVGTEKAQDKLREFISIPFKYGETKLYANELTQYAGWEFDGSQKRRNLFFTDCFPLHTKDNDQPDFTGEECRWCKRPLLFAYNITKPEKYITAFENKIKQFQVMTCAHCTHFATLYSNITPFGKCAWSNYNTNPDHMKNIDGFYGEYQDFSPQTIIQDKKVNTFHYESWLPEPQKFNGSIGGFPGWVQYNDYPSCPSCNKSMIYIAQYDISWVVYAFSCFECEINATMIQAD